MNDRVNDIDEHANVYIMESIKLTMKNNTTTERAILSLNCLLSYATPPIRCIFDLAIIMISGFCSIRKMKYNFT